MPLDILLQADVTSNAAPLIYASAPAPAFLPGQFYYLGVANNTATNASFVVQVDFHYDVTPLSNGFGFDTNTIGPVGTYQYFSLEITNNPIWVDFEVLNPSDDVNLLVAQDYLPDLYLPGYDFLSANPNNVSEIINSGSSPLLLTNGLWYLGVYNNSTNLANYTVRATGYVEDTNTAPLIGGGATNTVNPFTIQYFTINVPAAAIAASNTLACNTNLTVLYSSARPPLPGDYSLLTAPGTAVLRTNGTAPFLQPGQTYYLGVVNTNFATVTYTLSIDFAYLITPLANGILFTNTSLASSNLVQYYSFDVPTNTALLALELFNTGGQVKLLANQPGPCRTWPPMII